MSNQTSSQKGLGLGSFWPWLLFVDEALEALRGMSKGKEGKEPEVSQILWKLFLFVLFLAISPLGFVAGVGWLVAHLLGFDPVAGLKLIGAFEIAFIVLLVAWVVKKSRGPWSRAMKQARLEIGFNPNIGPGDLASRVRNALGQDEAAAKLADDVVRKVLSAAHPDWIGKKSQAPTRQLVIRTNRGGRKSKTDQPLARAPRSTVKRLGERDGDPKSGWDIH